VCVCWSVVPGLRPVRHSCSPLSRWLCSNADVLVLHARHRTWARRTSTLRWRSACWTACCTRSRSR
jgi:hypothetical protein